MSSESDAVRQLRSLESGLSKAASHLRRAALRSAAHRLVERASTAICIIGSSFLFIEIAGRWLALPVVSSAMMLVIGAISVVGVALVTLAPAVRFATPPEVTAQRLDLAADDHNAIATALEFARSNDISPMATIAIRHGVAALQRHQTLPPVAQTVPLRHKRVWPTAIAGLLLAIVGLSLPSASLAPGADQTGDRQLALLTDPHRSDLGTPPKPAESAAKEQGQPASDSKQPQTGKANAQSLTASTPSNAHAAVANSAKPTDAGSPNAVSELTTEGGSTQQPQPGRSTAEQNPPKPQDSAGNRTDGRQQKSMVSQSNSDSQSNSSASAKTGGSQAKSDSSDKSSEASDSQNGNSGNNDSSSSPPPADQNGGQPQGGNQGSDSPKAPDAPGSGNGRSSQSADSAGGNGQSSGQSPPKKSRGVAPLLLGSRQPDLLQGRPLNGPDQRTRVQLPPVHQPGDPDPAAVENRPQSPEPPTNVYRVPADQRSTVDAYFRRFHQDPSAAQQ